MYAGRSSRPLRKKSVIPLAKFTSGASANGEVGSCKIYGYRTVNDSLVIQEDEAEVVRRIFQFFLKGDSCNRIAKKLTKENIKSYSGKDFSGEVIATMTRQEKYTGCTLC